MKFRQMLKEITQLQSRGSQNRRPISISTFYVISMKFFYKYKHTTTTKFPQQYDAWRNEFQEKGSKTDLCLTQKILIIRGGLNLSHPHYLRFWWYTQINKKFFKYLFVAFTALLLIPNVNNTKMLRHIKYYFNFVIILYKTFHWNF